MTVRKRREEEARGRQSRLGKGRGEKRAQEERGVGGGSPGLGLKSLVSVDG